MRIKLHTHKLSGKQLGVLLLENSLVEEHLGSITEESLDSFAMSLDDVGNYETLTEDELECVLGEEPIPMGAEFLAWQNERDELKVYNSLDDSYRMAWSDETVVFFLETGEVIISDDFRSGDWEFYDE